MFLRLSRTLGRISLAGVTVGVAGVAALTSASGSASAAPASNPNPYLPSHGHSYRHGAIPTRAQERKIKGWQAIHAAGAATGPDTLYFWGGLSGSGGEGAVTSTPKVYLVFWGNQWGTQGTDSNGNTTLSSDYANGAPYLQQMFKGLGTNNELWSGTMTQYCDGPLVAFTASSCPSGAPHIGYPGGNALSGVWYDGGSAAPAAASQSQIAAEAVTAAQHFGNATVASNRYTQYVVLSAPGANPDNYMTGGFCAWHDSTPSSVGTIAYTNMPYVMDAGLSCGQNFVNSNGTRDGYSIVAGHEYAETLTDQFPSTGWVATSGYENGDECAWITAGRSGAAGDVGMATGSFAMQSTWSNDTNSCALSHAVVGSNTVTVTNPGNQNGVSGSAASLQISATDSGNSALTYSATNLPAGLTINSSTGLISGTPTTAGTSNVTVTAKDTTGAQGSAAFSWTIHNTVTVTNPGTQTGTSGTAANLQISATDSGNSALTYSATNLPAGLTINSSTGLISGTPTTAGTSNVTVTAKDTTGAQGSAAFSWTIHNTVTVTNPGNQTGAVSSATSLQISATDSGNASLTFSATNLPAGLSISSAGLISGSPSTAGTSNVTVTATDGTTASGSASFSWTINPAAGNTVTVTNPGNQTGTSGTAANLQISATDSGNSALTYSATNLPAGLTINSSTGLISGTPTTAGTSNVTVTATDTTNASGSTSFSWTIHNTVTVTNPGNQTGTSGTAANLQISATDSGGATLTYGATGLPAGLSINASNGLISGTPTTGANYSVTVTVTDTTSASGSAAFSWTIVNTVTMTNPGNQTGTAGTAASLQISATDSGNSALTYSATNLPAGLTINSSTGLISGTPTTAGTSNVTVTATDTTNASGSKSFSWTINPAGGNTVTFPNPPGSQSGTVGTPVSLKITASDSGGAALTYTATGLPPQLSISSTGQISGTPTTPGTYTVTVTAKDNTNASGSTTFTWTIHPKHHH